MTFGIGRRIASSRIGTKLARHPRITLTLLMLVVLVAAQGGAVAGDGSTDFGGDWGVSTQDNTTVNSGP